MPLCEMSGANWDIWDSSLFTATKAPTGGITLAALCSAWAAGTEDIYDIFHFYPFGVPICANGSPSWGDRATSCLLYTSDAADE